MNIKRQICELFEVHTDHGGVTRIVTPLEYVGTGDKIVVRVRQKDNGYSIDENGEAAFNAAMSGGDISSDVVERWLEEFHATGPVVFDQEDERLHVESEREDLIAPYIFRVAEAAQRLHAVATARAERQTGDFKERVKELMITVAEQLNIEISHDIELPIAGGLKADHVIGTEKPLLIIAATTPTRLLEAEVIYMQYRADKRPAHVWAIAENQVSVGRKQFERAGYYTDKVVVYQSDSLRHLVTAELTPTVH